VPTPLEHICSNKRKLKEPSGISIYVHAIIFNAGYREGRVSYIPYLTFESANKRNLDMNEK